jgi:hypothetical protein
MATRKTFDSMKEARDALKDALGFINDQKITLDEPLSLHELNTGGTHFAQLIVYAKKGEKVISLGIVEHLLEAGFAVYNIRYTRKDGLYILGSAYLKNDAKGDEKEGASPSSSKDETKAYAQFAKIKAKNEGAV